MGLDALLRCLVKEPETYLPHVAATLINLGVLDRARISRRRHGILFEEALDVPLR
jgi:hypothetical protein